ncbi:gamma carbonic anhydrase family protein [Jatrophihabitans sp.]|uniref:gamma carbonic anhydrase family protein n=1 Tax=Jatrophihabitans sp. TaxID=1932789 RepID=UPI0030C73493|nr:gamma carbonic anhydrase family protein [Jatrophihabitans sp.]
MAVWELAGKAPRIHRDAFVHPAATVIGAVTIGAGSSIWPGAVLRADFGEIVIGSGASIQDGSVLHCIRARPTVVGDGTIVGHLVHLEGCDVGSDCLIGSGSVVLNRAVIEDEAAVAAQALVTEGLCVPRGHIAVGVPARIKPADWVGDLVRAGSAEYMEMARTFASSARLIEA